MAKITLVITNWNGRKLLEKNLIPAITMSPQCQEVILADDHSSDDSLEYASDVQKKFPQLRIITHHENLGFGLNSNNAVKNAIGDYVVLFNSDITPTKNYLPASLKHFSDNSIFGVSFSEINHENYAKIYWKDGYLQHSPEFSPNTHISGWVSGGSSIVDKSKFLRLGGFDHVYHPFYSEDLDLGYRAWKSGYKLLWEPNSKVHHHHESTMSKFSKRELDYVKERNRLLTVWRNITNRDMLSQNRLACFGRVLSGPNYIKIILAAQRQIKSHPAPIVFPQLTDGQIFDLFK